MIEDHTNLKAKSKEERLKLDEVQDAIKNNLINNKDQWLNEDFMSSLAKYPTLMAALQDPETNKVLSGMKDDPKGTMEKYGHNPKFREVIDQFSNLMAGHFSNLAEKKEEE